MSERIWARGRGICGTLDGNSNGNSDNNFDSDKNGWRTTKTRNPVIMKGKRLVDEAESCQRPMGRGGGEKGIPSGEGPQASSTCSTGWVPLIA